LEIRRGCTDISCSSLVTILPGNTTCSKITALVLRLDNNVEFREDVLDIYVGSMDGSIDIFKVVMSLGASDQIIPSVTHTFHLRGHVGPITWMFTRDFLFVSKSSISKRTDESLTEREIFSCEFSSKFLCKNPEIFRKRESELTNTDLTEMVKKLSLQLTQSLRQMGSIAARQLLKSKIADFGKSMDDDGRSVSLRWLKRYSLDWKGALSQVPEFEDYDILLWNLGNLQCIRHLRQKATVEPAQVLPPDNKG